jgi:arylsulfatase A-like enzyme
METFTKPAVRWAGLLALMATIPTAVGAAAPAADPQPAGGSRPNIVFLLADDLGMGDLGCYGQKLLRTPHIDRLAAEGTRFTNAYCGASVCAPSRCALMTGRHMGHATIRGNWEVYPEGQAPLAQRDVTVAAALKQAGYATGICGKWGLGGPGSGSAPNDKGFDFFFGYNCQRHAHRYYTDYLYRNIERVEIRQSPQHLVYAQDLIAQESLDFIRRNKDRPFFLFCAWTLPHGPYRTDQVPDLRAYKDTGWSEAQNVYAAMVERLDADVGRVLATLKELKIDDQTLVIFASDNGAGGGRENNIRFGSAAGMRGEKGTLWEGGLRVPMIARWPGHVPAGRTSDFATAFCDFLPTAAALAGAAQPEADGISIVPTLLGREQPPRAYLYWEQSQGRQLAKAVRMGSWKGYQFKAGEPPELYHLATAPAEATNVAGQHPDVVKQIEAIMTAAHTDVEVPKSDPRIWKKYEEDNKKLDALLRGGADAGKSDK